MTTEHERLLTLAEAAGRLGLRESTLRAWRRTRRLPFVKIGRRAIRLEERVLRELIERGRIQARESSQGEAGIRGQR